MEANSALDPALVERMRKHFYDPYKVLKELQDSPRPEKLLQEWKASPEPSQEWRKGVFFDHSVLVLSAALSVSREEADKRAREYVAGGR